jgi:hypothetical protein
MLYCLQTFASNCDLRRYTMGVSVAVIAGWGLPDVARHVITKA